VWVALACGFALIVGAVAVTLARSPLVVAGTNSITTDTIVAETHGELSVCQSGEVVPGGTTAVRAGIGGNIQPTVRIQILAGSRVITRGSHLGGELGSGVTIPVARVPRTISNATICFALGEALEKVQLVGETSSEGASSATHGRVRIEYMRPGPRSWWSLASSVARSLGLGRAPSGSWVALIPIALMATAIFLTSSTIVRRVGGGVRNGVAPIRAPPTLRRNLQTNLRRVPGTAWACACVAALSAASWSIVTPPFEATDEPSHFAYTEILAETGRLPSASESTPPEQEQIVLSDLDLLSVRFNAAVPTVDTSAQQERLEHDLARPPGRAGTWAGVATAEPPLYYALQTIPYFLGSGGTLLDRLELMRLLSVLMAALTALFVFLFLREALPAVPWAWTVGGLGMALAPLLGFIGGVVTPDAMLCTVSAALFYLLARAFRRGLTPRIAIAIGAVAAVGSLTKLNFVGLAPGLLLALLVLTRRASRTSPRSAYGSLAVAVALAGLPVGAYTVINTLSNHAGLGVTSEGIAGTTRHAGTLLDELAYIWQLFLPRLPGMRSDFAGTFTPRLWFDRSVGMYGWLDTYFPQWVYTLALIPAGLIAALFTRELVLARPALWRRRGELLAYLTIGVGVLGLIGADSYLWFPGRAGGYAEPRYLLPMAALFAAVFALAARGAGRRWGPAVGALLVLLVLAQDIFSQLLEVGRFYG
jgi:hypothetical protein